MLFATAARKIAMRDVKPSAMVKMVLEQILVAANQGKCQVDIHLTVSITDEKFIKELGYRTMFAYEKLRVFW